MRRLPLHDPAATLPLMPGTSRGSRRWLPRLALVAALALGGCGNDAPPPVSDTDPDASAATPGEEVPDEGIELLLAVDQMTYSPGESVQVFLQLSNRSDQSRTLSFRTGQRYDLVILDSAGTELHRWSDDRSFTQALGQEELEAGQEGPAWEETLTAPDTPGEYRLRATVPAEGADLRTELPFEVSEEGP